MISYALSTGTLHIKPQASNWEMGDLFDVAERKNPKRSFLFVSKVLGRHIPVSPKIMRETYSELAYKIPKDLPEPILFIGMAETAVGLAAGVHNEYSKFKSEAVLITSTRHAIEGELMCEFIESHSHATDHLIYWPNDKTLKEKVRNARSLVLVDDEATTGNTFYNLIQSLNKTKHTPFVDICTVTLTDWSNNALSNLLKSPVISVSLMSGEWNWEPNGKSNNIKMPFVDVTGEGSVEISKTQNWGRLGVYNSTISLPNLTSKKDEKILVLGTGEFVWPPFLIAEHLENQGANVKYSSITRSPIANGLAIKNAFSFTDNYGLGIANFVYNIFPEQYDRIVLCTETSIESIDKTLLNSLNQPEIICYG